MSEMLQRAARALAESDGARFKTGSLYDRNPDLYLRLARAVLMAVREPGIDVGLIGAEQVNRNMRGKVKADYCAAKDTFAAMIDAILNDGGDQ